MSASYEAEWRARFDDAARLAPDQAEAVAADRGRS